MKVTCRYAAVAQIEETTLRAHVSESIHQDEIALVPGQQYAVHGLLFRCGVPWFYICEELESEYPKPFCAVFFDVVDSTIPNGWVLQWDGRNSSVVPRWWADMPNFLERLVDGDAKAQEVFRLGKGSSATPGAGSGSGP